MSSYRQQKAVKKISGKSNSGSTRRDSSPPPAPRPARTEKVEASSRVAALPRPAAPPSRTEKTRVEGDLAEKVITSTPAVIPPSGEGGDPVSGKASAGGSKRKATDSGRGRSDSKRPKSSWNFDYQSEYNICTDKSSTAFLVRQFRDPGCEIPPLEDLPADDREDYLKFSDAVALMLAGYNRTMHSGMLKAKAVAESSGLAEAKGRIEALSSEIESLVAEREKNADLVKQAKERQNRIARLEYKLDRCQIARDDYKGKFDLAMKNIYDDTATFTAQLKEAEARLQEEKRRASEAETRAAIAEARADALASTRESESRRAVAEARKAIGIRVSSCVEQVKLHLAARDAALDPFARAYETSSNIELLEEIVRGGITDFQAELEEVCADKESHMAALAEAEAKVPPLDLDSFVQVILGSPLPSQVVATPLAADAPETALDEFGTNVGFSMEEFLAETAPTTETELPRTETLQPAEVEVPCSEALQLADAEDGRTETSPTAAVDPALP